MTRVASRRRVDISGGVTGNAGSRRMSARQRERGRTMVESRRIPGGRRVTGGTVVIEIIRHMIGIGDSSKI
jgi:hypothetical protein